MLSPSRLGRTRRLHAFQRGRAVVGGPSRRGPHSSCGCYPALPACCPVLGRAWAYTHGCRRSRPQFGSGPVGVGWSRPPLWFLPVNAGRVLCTKTGQQLDLLDQGPGQPIQAYLHTRERDLEKKSYSSAGNLWKDQLSLTESEAGLRWQTCPSSNFEGATGPASDQRGQQLVAGIVYGTN